MSTINFTTPPSLNSRTAVIVWGTLANGDDGAPVPFSQYADKSVQVTGVFGVGGNLVWEGSNDGVTFLPLTDPQGNALNFTSAKIKLVSEATAYFRPRVTAGDGTTALSVALLMRE